jgi:hypothetical protein
MRSKLIRWVWLLGLAVAACTEEDCAGSGTGSCCKTCMNSKPCGDSCIANDQMCSKGVGCACSGLTGMGALFSDDEVPQETAEPTTAP